MSIAAEPNNCFPVALSQICTIDESNILSACVARGFNSRVAGMPTHEIPATMRDLGIEFTEVRSGDIRRCSSNGVSQPTTAQFAKNHREGTYLVLVTGHAIVIHNGKVFDPNMKSLRSRARVWYAYLIPNSPIVDKKRGTKFPKDPSFRTCRQNPFRRGTANFRAFQDMLSTHRPTWDTVLRLSDTTFTRKAFRYMVNRGHLELISK